MALVEPVEIECTTLLLRSIMGIHANEVVFSKAFAYDQRDRPPRPAVEKHLARSAVKAAASWTKLDASRVLFHGPQRVGGRWIALWTAPVKS